MQPLNGRSSSLSSEFLLVGDGPGTARRTPAAIAELANVDLQFTDGAAQRVAMHPQLQGGAALIAFVLFEHRRDKPFFEFSDRFRIKNIAPVHLQYERFQLIFHRLSLSVC